MAIGTYERVEQEASVRRMSTLMPDAELAVKGLKQHTGEVFCDFGFTDIAIGVIPDAPTVPISFAESRYSSEPHNWDGYVNLRSAGGIKYGLNWSGRSGAWPVESGSSSLAENYGIYLGKLPRGPVPNGPLAVETSHDVKTGFRYERLRDTLVIGNRACGAFAVGKALKESQERPENIDVSLGLLVAATLEENGIDWRPDSGLEGQSTALTLEKLRSIFVDYALVPRILGHLGLKSSHVHTTALGRRLPLFNFTALEIWQKVTEVMDNDKQTADNMADQRRSHGGFGNYDRYIKDSVNNLLVNRLGLTDRVSY